MAKGKTPGKKQESEEGLFEIVQLSNGVKLKKYSFPHIPFDNPDTKETIRHYIIDFNTLFSEKVFEFIEGIGEELKIPEDRLTTYFLSLRLYLYLNTPIYGKKKGKIQLSGKRIRSFVPDTLYYYKIFNPERGAGEHLQPEEVRKKAAAIKGFYEKNLLKTLDFTNKEDLARIFLDAAYEKVPKDTLPMVYYKHKIEDMLNTVGRYDVLLQQNKAKLDDKFIADLERELGERPAVIYLRTDRLNKILEELFNLLSRVEKSKENDEESLESVLHRNSEFTPEIDRIYSELLEYLYLRKKVLAAKRKIIPNGNEIADWVDMFIKQVEIYQKHDSIEKRFGYLPTVYSVLGEKDAFYQLLILKLENTVKFLISAYAKTVFKLLEKEENLSKAEKRLFIIYYMGAPSLLRKIPIFLPLLSRFFGFEEGLFSCFVESVLKKNSVVILDGDLAYYLGTIFIIYLKFYRFWHEAVKDEDRGKHAEETYRAHTVPLEQNEISSNEHVEGGNLPASRSKLQPSDSFDRESIEAEGEETSEPAPYDDEEGNNSADETTDPNKIKRGPKYIYREDDFDPDALDAKPKGKVDTYRMKESTEIPFGKTFELIRSILTEEEYNLIDALFMSGIPQSEIAASEGVSDEAIRKRKEKILKKLRNNPTIKDAFVL